MRVFAKVVERSSFAGAAARRGSVLPPPSLRHPASPPPPLGAEASGCALLAQGIGCAQPKPKILFLPRIEDRSTALRARKGWRANSPRVPSDRGLVGHGGSGRFVVVESACRPERKHGDEDTKEPSGGDFAAARQPMRRPRRWPSPWTGVTSSRPI